MIRVLSLADEAASTALATALAGAVRAPLTVFLRGELGAGKTFLVRAFLRACGQAGPVPSPTYTLVETYATPRFAVQHFDLYRLGDAEELEYIGVRDYFEQPAVRFIEWPERGAGLLPAPDLEVRLSVHGDGRQARLEARGEPGCRVLRQLPESFM